MTKVNYFRKRIQERYANNELAGAARSGEALLREHRNNEACKGKAYADDLFNLARVYDDMNYTERAVELYAESARLIFSEEGESLSFAYRLNNLAALLNKLGRGPSAYRLYAHMTAILRQHEGSHSLELADGLYNQGNAAVDIGRLEEAIRLHGEALTLRETAGSTEDIIHSLHSLAFTYEAKEEREQAIRFANLAAERAAGTDTYYAACYYLAELYDTSGQPDKAEPLYTTMLCWIERSAGINHSAYITVATRLANAWAAQGEYQKALDMQCTLRDILSQKAGEKHLFFANCLRSMAVLQKQLNEFEEAEPLMLKSMKIRLRYLGTGETHKKPRDMNGHARDIVIDAIFLIDMYIRSHQRDKALEMLVFALMQIGEEDPDYSDMLDMLTSAYVHAGHDQMDILLEEMEKLNDRTSIGMIIKRWIHWETQED